MCGCCGGLDWIVDEEWERQQQLKKLKEERVREQPEGVEVQVEVSRQADDRR